MDQITPKEVKILENPEDIQKRREQYFKRDADELEGWIYEKLQAASNESYMDLTNLHLKIQKHQVFEAEVAAHSNVIVLLDNTGSEMIAQHHFASDVIRKRLEELHRLWELVLSRLADMGLKLEEALDYVQFFRDCGMSFLIDKEAFGMTDEFGHDLEHVEPHMVLSD